MCEEKWCKKLQCTSEEERVSEKKSKNKYLADKEYGHEIKQSYPKEHKFKMKKNWGYKYYPYYNYKDNYYYKFNRYDQKNNYYHHSIYQKDNRYSKDYSPQKHFQKRSYDNFHENYKNYSQTHYNNNYY